jgi:hypothetical protein
MILCNQGTLDRTAFSVVSRPSGRPEMTMRDIHVAVAERDDGHLFV